MSNNYEIIALSKNIFLRKLPNVKRLGNTV